MEWPILPLTYKPFLKSLAISITSRMHCLMSKDSLGVCTGEAFHSQFPPYELVESNWVSHQGK